MWRYEIRRFSNFLYQLGQIDTLQIKLLVFSSEEKYSSIVKISSVFALSCVVGGWEPEDLRVLSNFNISMASDYQRLTHNYLPTPRR